MKTIEVSLRTAIKAMELVNDVPAFKNEVISTSSNTYEIESEDIYDEVVDMFNANDIEIL